MLDLPEIHPGSERGDSLELDSLSSHAPALSSTSANQLDSPDHHLAAQALEQTPSDNSSTTRCSPATLLDYPGVSQGLRRDSRSVFVVAQPLVWDSGGIADTLVDSPGVFLGPWCLC